jgi:excisionase family DNA binding protein
MIVANASPDSAILTKIEAAQLLRIRPRTLDDWLRRRRVPFCKLPGGSVRFRREQLLQFVAKYEQCSAEAL